MRYLDHGIMCFQIGHIYQNDPKNGWVVYRDSNYSVFKTELTPTNYYVNG